MRGAKAPLLVLVLGDEDDGRDYADHDENIE